MSAECPYCGTAAPLRFEIGDRNRRFSREIFRYYRCPSCHLIFISPIPPNLGDYYPTEYYGGRPDRERLLRAAALERFKIDMVRDFVQRGRLLEVGPSYGAFAHLAKQAGFEVDTIEIDSDCCAFLRDIVGVNVTQSGDPAQVLDDRRGQYDVIAMWHNIEHVPRPHIVFAAAARALRPRGILLIAAPNPDALQFRVFGKRWTHLDAPRHLELIPIPLLERWAVDSGLATELITTIDSGSLGWNKFGWRETLAATSANRYIRFMLRLAGSVVALPMAPLERSGRHGATFTAVFRST
jgi:SAM-dependent methyltransferase